jgi:hypothetical protein
MTSKKGLTLWLILLLAKGFGQYGAQLSVFKPAGDLAYILKPALGIEVTFKGREIEKQWKRGGSIGYASFKPTQETFQIYAIQSGSGGSVLLPGTQSYSKYTELPISFTNDISLLKGKKFSPLIGLDLCFFLITYSESSQIQTLSDITLMNENLWIFSVVPKVGFSYKVKETLFLTLGCAKSIGLIGTSTGQSFWKPFISLNYYPND